MQQPALFTFDEIVGTQLPPDEPGPVYQEITQAISSGLETLGATQKDAQEIALLVSSMLRDQFGGCQIYFRKDLRFVKRERDKEIYLTLDGCNTRMLAKKFGITMQRLYQIRRQINQEIRRAREN